MTENLGRQEATSYLLVRGFSWYKAELTKADTQQIQIIVGALIGPQDPWKLKMCPSLAPY